MGEEIRGTGELQVKILWGNTMLSMWESAGTASYDLCVASNCVIPSQGKGTIEIGLAISLH